MSHSAGPPDDPGPVPLARPPSRRSGESDDPPDDGVLPPVPENIWLHGLLMLVFVLLVQVARYVLGVCALIQFLWMLIAKERNAHLAAFGAGLGHWLATATRFVAGTSDRKPYPWTP